MAFPTIFSLSLSALDAEHAEVGASLLVMAIIGGALITPLMGLVSDGTGSVAVAYLVPAACFAIMAAYGAAHARGLLSGGAIGGGAIGTSASSRRPRHGDGDGDKVVLRGAGSVSSDVLTPSERL